MLDSLRGLVLSRSDDAVVLECGGVAFRLRTPPDTTRSLRVGEEARLFCHLLVRDEVFHLFGFVTEAEREIFIVLLGVAGLGPEKARALLGRMPPRAIVESIRAEDDKAFQIIKGIGAKLAQRMVLELKGKLEVVPLGADELASARPAGTGSATADVMAALIQLGYPRAVAEGAAIETLAEHGVEPPLEALVKDALRRLQKPAAS